MLVVGVASGVAGDEGILDLGGSSVVVSRQSLFLMAFERLGVSVGCPLPCIRRAELHVDDQDGRNTIAPPSNMKFVGEDSVMIPPATTTVLERHYFADGPGGFERVRARGGRCKKNKGRHAYFSVSLSSRAGPLPASARFAVAVGGV